ncbi:MAG: flagellar export protein FliJ [Pirellulales bacterium]|nr:flagellar export protein FliJ [Pirellulales bacterium]
MAKYKFRLNTLQRVREAARDERRTALAEAFRAEQVLADRKTELAAEIAGLEALRRTASAGRYLDVNRMLEVQRYELLLRAQGQEIAKQEVLLAAETERRRQFLVEADREVRVLEKLDERYQKEFQVEQVRRETKRLDEVATNRWRASGETH